MIMKLVRLKILWMLPCTYDEEPTTACITELMREGEWTSSRSTFGSVKKGTPSLIISPNRRWSSTMLSTTASSLKRSTYSSIKSTSMCKNSIIKSGESSLNSAITKSSWRWIRAPCNESWIWRMSFTAVLEVLKYGSRNEWGSGDWKCFSKYIILRGRMSKATCFMNSVLPFKRCNT